MAQGAAAGTVEAVDLRHRSAPTGSVEHQVSQPTLLLPHPEMVWRGRQPRRQLIATGCET